MKKLLVCFAAGCVGALANSLVVWIFADLGIPKKLGVSLAAPVSAAWLYPRLVWGGIWATTFVLPFKNSSWIVKGVLLSLLPSLFQLFYVLPYQAHKGMAGMELGMLTPALVVFYNAVWGIVAGVTLKLSK